MQSTAAERLQPAVSVDEPLAEAIMVAGDAGISFSSRGRALTPTPER